MSTVNSKFDLNQDPLKHFEDSFAQAKKVQPKEPNAVSLASATLSGIPTVRTVLYKGLIRQGFSFFTNYESQKGKELTSNPRAAMLFYWPELYHQVRIEGVIEKLTRAESEAYFKTRQRESQIGAWASRQSHHLDSLEDLEVRVEEFEKKFKDQDVPCPPNWGGFLLHPLNIEFWFGKNARLHERYVYRRKDIKSAWKPGMKFP